MPNEFPAPKIKHVKCRDCSTMIPEPITGGMAGVQGRCIKCHENWLDFLYPITRAPQQNATVGGAENQNKEKDNGPRTYSA